MSKKKPVGKAKATEPEKSIDGQLDYGEILLRLYSAEIEIGWLKDRLDKLEAAPKSWSWWK